MAIAQSRIRSLETARECVSLGARQRTIAWVTGLPAGFILDKVFDARHPAPRGRPPYSEKFLFGSPLRIQAEVSAFATKYRLLTSEGFVASRALVTAFKHYLSMAPGPSLSFDEAFFVVANLDGIWAVSAATLELGGCRRCGCLHVFPRGGALHDGCPFCKLPDGAVDSPLLQRHAPPTARQASVQGDAIEGHSAALDQRIRAMRLERSLEALGAHERIVATIARHSPLPKGPAAAAHVAPIRFGRPINLVRWGVANKTLQRVQYSLVATVYRRLRAADFAPEDALRAAFVHVSPLFRTGPSLSFDRCFEIIALFDALWGVNEAELDLLECTQCHSQYLASRRDRAPPHCPFCALSRRPARYL